MIPVDEKARCAVVAMRHGIDHRLLIAMRATENGGPGREFGILDPRCQTWDEQADWSARTIRHTIGRWAAHVGGEWWDDQRGCFLEPFLLYLSRGGPGYEGYAELGAKNDPTGLNASHFPNLAHFYAEQCR